MNDSFNRPAFSLVTELKVEPDTETQIRVTTTLKYKIEDGEQIGELIDKHEKEERDIMWTWPKNVDTPVPDVRKADKKAVANKGPSKFTRAGRK